MLISVGEARLVQQLAVGRFGDPCGKRRGADGVVGRVAIRRKERSLAMAPSLDEMPISQSLKSTTGRQNGLSVVSSIYIMHSLIATSMVCLATYRFDQYIAEHSPFPTALWPHSPNQMENPLIS